MEAKENEQHVCDYFPFLELPPELVLRVCDYLDSYTVINVLSKVCQFLHDLAADDLIWKTRIHKRWPGKRYPVVSADRNFDWQSACISRETEYRKWKSPVEFMQRKDVSFGICIDVVHITQTDHLILGMRDHTLYSFKVSDIPGIESNGEETLESIDDVIKRDPSPLNVQNILNKKAFQKNAHAGWIWSISSDKEKLCSGGWDSKLKLWEYSGDEISLYRCGSAVLCSAMAGDEILAGTFNKTLFKIDTRCKEPVTSKRIHARAVLCIQRTDRWIITGSESKIINIIDRNTFKTVNTAKLPAGYPGNMSLVGNTLYIGSNLGAIHIFSFNEQLGHLSFVESVENSHQKAVRSVRQTLGSVLTASKDGTCKIWEPSGTPSVIQTLSTAKENDEICTMDYQNGTMTMGTGDGSLSLFRPKYF